ncbi:DUF6157 family protein [Zavarzinella formosa]|uniref:DUF6157 family protein n=1 Tax=Zavarzinella formosa TaxID=360055 RepID=UPI00030BF266|nr:DUF6157 family protein [Zavarzinella formosa]
MKPINNTFVLVSPDCPATTAIIPSPRGGNPTVAVIQHKLLTTQPYSLTLEDLIFQTHVLRSNLSTVEMNVRAAEIRKTLFGKSHPCMRASPLPKQYGWGVHHDEAGRIAIYGLETEEYRRLASGEIDRLEIVIAMRNKRAK